jgi:hypothetical protein
MKRHFGAWGSFLETKWGITLAELCRGRPTFRRSRKKIPQQKKISAAARGTVERAEHLADFHVEGFCELEPRLN